VRIERLRIRLIWPLAALAVLGWASGPGALASSTATQAADAAPDVSEDRAPGANAPLPRPVPRAGATGAAALGGRVPMPAPDPDRVAAGRRLYEGLDPRPAHGIDGSALASYSTACVRCHRPSGLGSAAVEPNVPPITGAFLFEPLDPATGQRFPWPATFRARPAYDIAALQELLASGRAPDGFELREPMPRYVLSTEDVQALAAYLRHLSMASVPPGVEDRTVRFATVTTPEAPADEVRALVATLQRYAAERGSAAHPEHAGARGDAGDDPGAGRAWRVEH
jgi:hypothetical protein